MRSGRVTERLWGQSCWSNPKAVGLNHPTPGGDPGPERGTDGGAMSGCGGSQPFCPRGGWVTDPCGPAAYTQLQIFTYFCKPALSPLRLGRFLQLHAVTSAASTRKRGWGMLSHREGQSTPWQPTAPVGTGMGTHPDWLEASSGSVATSCRAALGGTGITAGWPSSAERATSDCHGNAAFGSGDQSGSLGPVPSAQRAGPCCVPVTPQRVLVTPQRRWHGPC